MLIMTSKQSLLNLFIFKWHFYFSCVVNKCGCVNNSDKNKARYRAGLDYFVAVYKYSVVSFTLVGETNTRRPGYLVMIGCFVPGLPDWIFHPLLLNIVEHALINFITTSFYLFIFFFKFQINISLFLISIDFRWEIWVINFWKIS